MTSYEQFIFRHPKLPARYGHRRCIWRRCGISRSESHTGGDVDSLASITTGIMAGRAGLDSLPDWMMQQVEGRAYLENLAERFYDFLKK